MKCNKIVVLGSCNTDLVIKTDHLPKPGETVLGGDFITNQGGKGANQAVSVSRLGGNVLFISKVGNDSFGKKTLQSLEQEQIDTRFCFTTNEAPTGIAMISVDKRGENSIIVASGANSLLTPEDVERALPEIENADILLMQMETPVPTITYAAKKAHEAGVKVVLNPAPYPKQPLPEELKKNIDILIPNETEAQGLCGIIVTDEDSAYQAIKAIQNQGIKQVLITAGASGVYAEIGGTIKCVPTFKANVVDTTAAGDTFCGALCVALSEGKDMESAILFANKAASLCVTRMGAWQSIPKKEELN